MPELAIFLLGLSEGRYTSYTAIQLFKIQ